MYKFFHRQTNHRNQDKRFLSYKNKNFTWLRLFLTRKYCLVWWLPVSDFFLLSFFGCMAKGKFSNFFLTFWETRGEGNWVFKKMVLEILYGCGAHLLTQLLYEDKIVIVDLIKRVVWSLSFQPLGLGMPNLLFPWNVACRVSF